MAFSVRIEGISKETGRVVLTIEPRWWDANELRADDRFKDISTDLGYEDLEAHLWFEDMRVLHEKYKGGAGSLMRCEMQELETALYTSVDTYSFFHVTVSEM
jgi:hypothetical protein